jgi:hypothetical protein
MVSRAVTRSNGKGLEGFNAKTHLTLVRLLHTYRETHAGRFDHLDLYRRVPFKEAIRLAALSQVRNKKGNLVRHSHQTRVPARSLEVAKRRLLRLGPALARCRTFDELYETVSSIRRRPSAIPGIGDLAIYDISLRIGAKRGLEPEMVYLHRGVRDGARALGLDFRRSALATAELPAPLRRLTARDAEDFLSVFADKFARIRAR